MEAHKAEKPGNAELQAQLDAWMEEFEEEEAARKREALASMEDDGWTVVQRHKVGWGLGWAGGGRQVAAAGLGAGGGVPALAGQRFAFLPVSSIFSSTRRLQGRKKNSTATGVTVGGVAKASAAARAADPAKQSAAFSDFYRFQKRDQRRDDLLDLRSKFEEDKRRIQELKASRRFKPY